MVVTDKREVVGISILRQLAGLDLAGLLTYAETNNHWLTPQYAGDIAKCDCRNYPAVGIAPPYLISEYTANSREFMRHFQTTCSIPEAVFTCMYQRDNITCCSGFMDIISVNSI